MRALRWAVVVVLVGVGFAIGRGQATSGVSFRGVGEPGVTGSNVQSATKVGSTVYAVGQSVAPPSGVDATIWTLPGAGAAVRDPLPDLGAVGIPAAVSAFAITPSGTYVASQLRKANGNNGRRAARVIRSPFAADDLSGLPYFPADALNSNATAISDGGGVLYGSYAGRAYRFDVGAGTTLIPVTGNRPNNSPADRGTSSNGAVMVGTAFTPAAAPIPPDSLAFRYVHGASQAVQVVFPLLPGAGGGWSKALAVSPNGNLTLAAGNSASFPNGEIYLHDATIVSGDPRTPLGSPNTAWIPSGFGGMTADGSVVAASFSNSGNAGLFAGTSPRRHAYVRNSQGWFHLTSVLAASGVDVAAAGWSELQVNGMSPDGTLIFGQGLHGTVPEGFIAEFPAGHLAAFDPQPAAPADMAVVGAWEFDSGNPADPAFVAFMADGTYYSLMNSGFERGLYSWNGATGALDVTTVQDMNGDDGLSDLNGMLSGVTFNPTTGVAQVGSTSIPGSRLAGGPGSVVGGWVLGNPAEADSSVVVVLTAGGKYLLGQDGPDDDPTGRDGIEVGTYSWNGVQFGATSITVDTNGEWGLSHPVSPAGDETLTLTADDLVAIYADPPEIGTARRIVAPPVAATPVGGAVVVAPTASLSLTFDTVTAAGDTTVEVIDPQADPDAPEPPAGFSLGDPPIYYEIDTTAVFNGPVTVCFNYAGIDFGLSTPRLFHYESGAWVDITTDVDPGTSTICGVTTSFSPFAIFVSPVTRTGFYQPVDSTPGIVNTVKGGSTVPLKFNVYVDGVEKTDTGGLSFGVWSVGCPGSATGESPVGTTTTGNTSLRYDSDAGMFVQNWRTPTGAGCYVARITTAADGLSLSALFKMK